jgi:hypothetical protein
LTHFIEWRPTPERNVEVLNDTTCWYRHQALPAIKDSKEIASILAPLLRAAHEPCL